MLRKSNLSTPPPSTESQGTRRRLWWRLSAFLLVLFLLGATLSYVLLQKHEVQVHAAPTAKVPLGLNLDLNEQSYVDPGTTARLQAVGSNALTADSNGWPTSDFLYIIDNRYTYAWIPGAVNIDPQKKSTDISGTYKLSFSGQAVLSNASDDPAHDATKITNQKYDSATNTTTADITLGNPPGGVLMILKFAETKRTASAGAGTGITDLHFVRPGYNPGTNQVFTDLWWSSLKNHNWTAFRFMGVLGTNGYGDPATDGHPNSELYPYRLKWTTDRNQPGVGPLYGLNHPGVQGIPWEYVVLIAQETHKDIWINIPVNASDDYVTQLATLLKNGNAFTGNKGIPDDVNIYTEYSNEMWHFGFHQGPWNLQAAKDEIAAGGSKLNYDGKSDDETIRFRRIARRTVEIGNQFKTVFADNGKRIRPVTDNAFIDHDPDMLDFIKANYGPVNQYLYGISSTGYYSSDDKSSVDAIIAGEKKASDKNKADYVKSHQIAEQYGIHSLVYEGGQDEQGNKQPVSPVDTTLANQFGAVRDPRMQDVEVHDLTDNWYPSGGELYMQFGHVGRMSTYGMWGLSEDLTDQATGKWKGVDQVMGMPVPESTPTVPGTTATATTPASTATVPGTTATATAPVGTPTPGGTPVVLSGSNINDGKGTWSGCPTCTAEKSFDGNTSTYYDAAQAKGAWTGIDLVKKAQVTTIRYYPRDGFADRMVGGKFQASNDQTVWIDLATITTQPKQGEWSSITVNNTTGFRYLRYLAGDQGSYGGSYGNVSEVQFVGITN